MHSFFSRTLISWVLTFALVVQSLIPAFATLPPFQSPAPEHVALRQEAATVIGENAAQEIGAAYHGGELNKFTQLVAHAAVGCTSGAVASGDCASGAFGGVVGEIAGEVQQRRIEQRLQRELSDGAISQEEAVAFAEAMRAAGVDLARLASGLGAALSGGEVTAAADAGGMAAQENAFWVPLIMIFGALWTAYDVATTYRDEGGEAVLEQLAVDGAITVAAGGAGKVLYTVGGKVFRSGPKAWQAVKKAGLWKRGTKNVVPSKANDVFKHIKQKGKPPTGYKGGKIFKNDGRNGGWVLPKSDSSGNLIVYKEYDVNIYKKGVNRGTERIVLGSNGKAYYTSDHYATFIPLE